MVTASSASAFSRSAISSGCSASIALSMRRLGDILWFLRGLRGVLAWLRELQNEK